MCKPSHQPIATVPIRQGTQKLQVALAALQARLKACEQSQHHSSGGTRALMQGQSTHGSGQGGPLPSHKSTRAQELGLWPASVWTAPVRALNLPVCWQTAHTGITTGLGHGTPPAAAPGLTPTGHQEAFLHVAWQCPGTGERGRENTIN